jgi:5-methylcytosine-specific restriction protein A
MVRAPRICLESGCLQKSVKAGRCQGHQRDTWASANKRWKTQKPRNWNTLRLQVIRRDNGRCYMCGLPGNFVDHIKPVAEGGSWSLSNLAVACEPCHRSKTGRENARARARKARPKGDRRPCGHSWGYTDCRCPGRR